MKIQGRHYRTVWLEEDTVCVIDQRKLPHQFVVEKITTCEEMVVAIRDMYVRGAPLIGACGAFGAYLAAKESTSLDEFEQKLESLNKSRPTAVNLTWATERQLSLIDENLTWQDNAARLKEEALLIVEEDEQCSKKIGEHGLEIIRKLSEQKNGEMVNILTHCNAGWLATIDYGTATAPIYYAHNANIPVHVWIDETRPRLQGSKLTAFELQEEQIPCTLISDNTGGHLMQHGQVDLCIVGTDRTTSTGDVANKVGTYLKALAAKANNVPFYVAAPSSSIDWTLRDGLKEIPIETRCEQEILCIEDHESSVSIAPDGTKALNIAFDVTPRELVSGLITERGLVDADEAALARVFPDLLK